MSLNFNSNAKTSMRKYDERYRWLLSPIIQLSQYAHVGISPDLNDKLIESFYECGKQLRMWRYNIIKYADLRGFPCTLTPSGRGYLAEVDDTDYQYSHSRQVGQIYMKVDTKSFQPE